MKYIRLKTDLKEESFQNRMKYHPEIIEFHLQDTDLEDVDFIVSKIRKAKECGSKVYLHHPSLYKGKKQDILHEEKEMKDYYDWSSKTLADICKKENIHCVIRPNYSGTKFSTISNENTKKVRKRIEEILTFEGAEWFLWEDSIEGVFSYQNKQILKEIIEPLHLPIIVDISHSFVAVKGSNEKLEEILKATKPFAKYYHVVDSMGVEHDSLSLGKGKIDWKMVKPYIKDSPFIFEIGLVPPHIDCAPMIESAEYFDQL